MDGGVVGGAFLSAFLQVVFDRLASREVVGFLSGKKDIDDLLNMLKVKLLSANTVLDDAEARQLTKPAVKNWLEELKHEIYRAEDLLDEIATEALRHKVGYVPESNTSQVTKIFAQSSTSQVTRTFSPSVIRAKIKEIIERVEFILKERDLLGLKDSAGDCKPLPSIPTTSLVDDREIYGRDDDKEAIMKMLISNDDSDNKSSVISIVGMGGVGKTTLAQLLYNDTTVDQLFALKAWVCVSRNFDVTRLTKEILDGFGLALGTNNSADSEEEYFRYQSTERVRGFRQQFDGSTSNSLTQHQVNLKATVTGKKFLLVLDDIWSDNYFRWERILYPLKYGANGSKIIITSRSEKVASIFSTTAIYFLKPLTDEYCWLLFAKHAYTRGDFLQPAQEVIGKKIAKRCHGLPLAAKALGTLLRSKYAPSQWNDLLESDMSELVDEDSHIIPSLQLSYQYLPSHLRQCFAYCSIFPKSFRFEKKELVQLWMAENLLQQASGIKRLEDLGDEYFNDLVSLSFFQPSSGNQQNFFMHDLIHDLAKSVAGCFALRFEKLFSKGNAGFFLTMPEERLRPVATERTRHASYRGYKLLSVVVTNLKTAKYLRTLLHLDVGLPCSALTLNEGYSDWWKDFTQLRVLSLHHVRDIPYEIGDMCHLRYLDFSGCDIITLPDSICGLINLMVLKLFNCKNLVELPTYTYKLINLRHLDIRNTNLKEMPTNVGRLQNLQTLTSFFLCKDKGSSIKELGHLQQLRGELSIIQLQNVVVTEDASKANMGEKKGLEKLSLQWNSCTCNSERERLLLNDLQPNENLEELTIDGYGGTRFPSWVGHYLFSDLTSVHLIRCHYCFSLPPLGQLPSLRSLFIREFNQLEIVGQEFYGHNQPFRCLEVLEFRMLPMWKKWIPYDHGDVVTLPCLQELQIIDCSGLVDDLPSVLPSLTELKIERCPLLATSLPKVHAINELIVKSCGLHWNQFENLGGSQYEFTTLSVIRIYNCPAIEAFPRGGLLAPSLKELSLNTCKNLKTLPERMNTLLSSLEYLFISDCPELESFPEGGLPFSLNRLAILGCEKLVANRFQWDLQILPSLKWFEISHQATATESLLEDVLLPISLTTLEINNCLNLTSLTNGQICFPPALQELRVQDCPKLQRLPEEDLPESLSFLQIRSCPLLVQRYQYNQGEAWPKIARIPCIWIDDRIITLNSDNTHEVQGWSGQEYGRKKRHH